MSHERPYTDLEVVRDITFSDAPDIVRSAGGHAETDQPEDSLWPALWNERKLLLWWAAAGLTLTLIISLFIPNRYTSTVRLMPPDSQNATGLGMLSLLSGGGNGASASALALGGDLLGLRPTGALFMGILNSRTLQDDIVNEFDLRKVYRDKYFKEAREELSDNVEITEDHKAGIITVRVTDKNRERATEIARGYVAELNKLSSMLSTGSARREREFLEQRLVVVKSELDAASVQLSEFSSKNTAINIDEQAKAMVGAAAQLEGELVASRSQLSALKQIYSDGNVRVRELQARINELETQLGKVSGTPGGQRNAPSASETSSDAAMPAIRELPILGVKYFDLYRRAKIEEAVYETLTKQYELAKVQEAKETPSVQVLDAPDVPERKSFPPRALMSATGCILFLVLGALFVRSKQLYRAQAATHTPGAFAYQMWMIGSARATPLLVKLRAGRAARAAEE